MQKSMMNLIRYFHETQTQRPMNKEMKSLYDVDDLVSYVNRSVEDFFAANECHTEVRPETLGLDERAGRNFIVSPKTANFRFMAIHQDHARGLDYYGGFEYLDEDSRKQVGEWLIFTPDWNEDECRIQNCIDRFDAHSA